MQHTNDEATNGLKVLIYQRRAVQESVPRQSEKNSDLVQLATTNGFSNEQIILFVEDIETCTFESLLETLDTGTVTAIICKSVWHLVRYATALKRERFLQLCTTHRVTIVTPSDTYAFTSAQEVEQFRFLCQNAAEYLFTHVKMMRSRRRSKAQEKHQ